jgi:hypothetical protein
MAVKSIAQKLASAIALSVLLGAGLFATAAAKSETFTGEVSDSMCGAKHAMAGNKGECTRACMKKGSNYALVVGDKVYTLQTTDQTALAQLDKLAGEKANVSGTATGDIIAVSKVSAAK